MKQFKICFVLSEQIHSEYISAICHLVIQLNRFYKIEVLLVENPFEDQASPFKNKVLELSLCGVRHFSLSVPDYILHTPFLSVARSYLVYDTLKKIKYDAVIFTDIGGLGYYSILAKKVEHNFDRTKFITLNLYSKNLKSQFDKHLATSLNDIALDFAETQSMNNSHLVISPFNNRNGDVDSVNEKSILAVKTIPFPMTFIKEKNNLKKNKKINLFFICRFNADKEFIDFTKFLESLIYSFQDQEIIFIFLFPEDSSYLNEKKHMLFSFKKSLYCKFKIVKYKTFVNCFEQVKRLGGVMALPKDEEILNLIISFCINSSIPYVNYENLLKTFSLDESRFEHENTMDLVDSSSLGLWREAIDEVIEKNDLIKSDNIGKISVCIIFFDRHEFLIDCLSSLLEVDDLIEEILIYVNKESSLESVELIAKIRLNPKIVIIKDKLNTSPGYAYNALARKAMSESLLFIDDDNILDFRAFRKLWNYLDDDWDIICCPLKKFENSDFVKIKKKKAIVHKHSSFDFNKKLDQIVFAKWLPLGGEISTSLFINTIGDNNYLVKKSHIIKMAGVNEEMRYGEDVEFLIRSVCSGARYVLSPESFIFYRKHDSNLSKEGESVVQKSKKMLFHNLKGVGCDFLFPLIQVNLARKTIDDYNPDGYELGQIELATIYRSAKNNINVKNVATLRKKIFNKIQLNVKEKKLICHLGIQPIKKNLKNIFPDTLSRFIFFSREQDFLFINGEPVLLKAGYSSITVSHDSKSRIHFYGKLKKIEFIEIAN